ncbi:MAG: Peptidoglycan glycosyltransferase MrdB [Anaerolineales bacterium]|nr:rod shape-determining protein RodA [Anaerolineae bacterium]MBL8105990.1 rod shape-determining protein RodA [Anaerolineales bacterium]MBV6401539.1 Peptidoglycan glycosyltransferase MrdB [Anaerolineales bacterium]MCC7189085.1 rod shape-determining protein RodA [Anaerolineales bacterium]HQU35453.1 FtsW/RodA/SpoVE family cell cycle protein [Anaerolineales bacterium]
MLKNISWRYFDFWLLGAVVLATAFGTTMIRSAVAGNEVLLPLINRQIYFALAGLVLIFVVAAIDYRYWMALYRPMYLVILLFLVTLTGFGQTAFGAQRWFQVGVLFLQPTEFAKIVAILVLARYFQATQNQPRDLRWLIGAVVWASGIIGLILLQPNLSNVVVLSVILGALLWLNGMEVKHVIMVGAVGTISFIAIVGLTAAGIRIPFLQEYQQDRIANFILPEEDATFGATYNVSQALIAIGSGGVTGQGYGHGTQTQLRFLKVRHTDFIFSAISEEFGFVGALLVIVIIMLVIWRCLRAAQKARDVAGMNIAYGVAILIFFQGMVNIGVNLNIVPVSGLPLPFISYGGSGLTSLMLGIGLVESVAMRFRQLEF